MRMPNGMRRIRRVLAPLLALVLLVMPGMAGWAGHAVAAPAHHALAHPCAAHEAAVSPKCEDHGHQTPGILCCDSTQCPTTLAVTPVLYLEPLPTPGMHVLHVAAHTLPGGAAVAPVVPPPRVLA